MELDSDVNADELSHILNAYRKKKKFYQLKNGEMIDLEDTGLEQLNELASTMNLTTKDFKKETIDPKSGIYFTTVRKEEFYD